MTMFAHSKVILFVELKEWFYVHVSDSANENFATLNFLDFFVKSCLVLGKFWSHVGVQRAFGGSFWSPQKLQKLSSGSNESSIFAKSEGIFLAFFLRKNKKNMKIELSFERELNFCGPVPLKKAFHRLALSFVILWILPHPNRIWGGTCGPKRCAQHLIGV